jgi:hypothetical protein
MKQQNENEELDIVEAVEHVVSYLWNAELEDYRASGRAEGHIFPWLEILNQWSHRKRKGAA